MRRARIVVLSFLALAAPALALGGEPAPPGPAGMSVSASLEGCGVANAAIVCQIDARWSGVDGADSYSVSVTRPDGSVVDLGQGAGTSRSAFVPYVGPGTYSLEVVAWGDPPGDEDPEVLARSKTLSTAGEEASGADTSPEEAPAASGEDRGTTDPAEAEAEPSADPPPAPPECEAPDEAAAVAELPGSEGEDDSGQERSVVTADAPAPTEASAEAEEPVECP